MKRKMMNCVMAIVLVFLLIINLLPDMAVALEKNDNTVADYAANRFSDGYDIQNSLYQTKTIENLNGEVNLDFHESSQNDEGTLEIDGYHWEAASKTLTVNGIKKFGIVILPQKYEVTVNVQGDDNYIKNLQFKNEDNGVSAAIKVTFSGKGTLTVKESINMSGGDNSSFTVEDGVEFIASGINIGASGGINSMVTVNGTLTVQNVNEMAVGINAGMLKIGSTGKLSVSGNKGVGLNGMSINNKITFENAFYIEEGGQFISNCAEFGIVIFFGNCGYGYSVKDVTDKEAEKMLVVPEIDLPVGYKARVAKSRAYGEEGEEYYACAITIGHEKADLKIDDDGRIIGSEGSINIQSHNHVLTNVPFKAATCTQDGNKEYWICKKCTRVYSDEQGTTLIPIEATVILALHHDFTGDFNAYDEDSHWHICKRENCNATDEHQSHDFTKYEYNNNADYFADGTETAVCDADGCLQTHTRIKENSKLIDSTAPTGEIKVNENRFKAFINTITFGIFCNDKYDVTITAEDNETGIEHIEYYISETALSETDIEHVENWTEYESFSIENEGKYIIYAKITNKVGGVAYISSDGMVVDKTAPAIVGIEDKKTYCHEVTFTVSDDNLDYVTVNNVRTTDYTLRANGSTYIIEAFDKAGNKSGRYTVTVNDGHIIAYHEAKEATCEANGNKEYWRCDCCGKYFADADCTEEIIEADTIIMALGHDFTGDFNAYDENSHWHICNRENCNATDKYQSHHFTEYQYQNNANYFADGTETAVCDAPGCLQTHTRIRENSKLIDSTAPTGEIKVNENPFKAFINTITFGIFCNDKYDVTITAEDNETGIEHIEYYISETALSETDIEHVENWTEYENFSIENEGKYIIYAKITNKVGSVVYISSDGMVVDKIAPAIVGIEDNKTYCHEVTFTVSDDNLDYVAIDNEIVNNVHTTYYTLIADGLKHTVKVCDKAGNESYCTVTVNNGHTFTKYVSNGDATCTEDGTETATCDFCDEKHTKTAVGSKHGHIIAYHEAKAATCEANGNKEYWRCDRCGKYFADADCTKEMTEAETVIMTLGHDFTGDFNAYDENSHWHICNRENCNATDEHQSHHFTEYKYQNNADYFADGTETAACDAPGCLQTHTRIRENSKLIDSTMPTGEIKVNENRFKAFINTITFGIFCDDKYDVTITAEDNETGIEHIAYYISETAFSETDIEYVENWTEYKSFSIENEGKYIIYAKITNKVGGVVYISSDGMVIDKIAPAIVGIEDNKTYCHEVTFTVSDDNLDYVAIDNEIVNNIRATHYTIIADGLKHTVKVCDKAGNESYCTVTVNNGHTFTQYVSNGDATCTEDGTETAMCDFCNEKDTKTAVGSKLGHNYGKPVFNWSDDGKTCKVIFTCENDGKYTIIDNGKITSMIKRNATCIKNGIVSYTITVEFENKIYTDTKDVIIPPIPHNIENRNSKKETCIEEGYTGDKLCTICDEIIEKGTIIPKRNHSYEDGICTVCGLTEPDFQPDELADNPQTSDSSNLMLWIALLFIAGGFFAKTTAYGRKKKQ